GVDAAAPPPLSRTLRGLKTTYILKRALADALPPETLARPKKGFGIPLGHWFRGALRPLVREVCGADAIRRGGLFRPEAVERLLSEHESQRRDHRTQLYTLLAFQ